MPIWQMTPNQALAVSVYARVRGLWRSGRKAEARELADDYGGAYNPNFNFVYGKPPKRSTPRN